MLCLAVADGGLAAIWIAADDRKAVSDAAYAIEQALTDDPLGYGDSREVNQRIMFVTPLGVRYVVLQESQSVVIGQFWTFASETGDTAQPWPAGKPLSLTGVAGGP